MVKRKPNPKQKRLMTKPKTEQWVWTTEKEVIWNVQGPSTAKCMVLTTYHNFPTGFISFQQWVEGA
jgi:hypothetical protein